MKLTRKLRQRDRFARLTLQQHDHHRRARARLAPIEEKRPADVEPFAGKKMSDLETRRESLREKHRLDALREARQRRTRIGPAWKAQDRHCGVVRVHRLER